jgi:diguanylate cyclase (GGDEF)-like protein
VTIISTLRALLAAFLVLFVAPPAMAEIVDLHPQLCIRGQADAIAQIAEGAYRIAPCTDTSTPAGWTEVELHPAPSLAALPQNWRLVIDGNRFDRIVLTATARDGRVQRIARDPDSLGPYWAPGNALSFPIAFGGKDLAKLSLAFERLDGPLFIRKVVAMDATAERVRSDHWLLLIGLFVGAVFSAIFYNIMIYVGERSRFQRWYLVWACSALLYGAWWTNLMGFVSDLLVGPRAVRVESICLGFVVASGAMFLLSLLEAGTLPRWLSTAGKIIAGVTAASGIVAALDHLVPAVPADRWFNAILALNTLWVLACVTAAISRRSRIVWFYLAGWLPVLALFVLRLARNLGLLPQDDAIDMATFAAIALETIILSITISRRFAHLKRERDSANSAIEAMKIEADILRRAAQTDFLTGLGNRALFQTSLDRIGPNIALFLIDVDHLKEVNDSFGHQHGDALLMHVAERLRATVPDPIMMARVGGDEFAILLPEDRENEAALALDGLQGKPWTHAGRSHSLSLSIGHARSGHDAPTAASLYQQADFALYRAKNMGRGRRHRYDPTVAKLLDLEASLLAEAPRALANGEFVLHYQPIVDIAHGRQVSAEALLRWDHPVHGLLTPQSFASMLADEALGPLIQDHVLAIALSALAEEGDRIAYLSVNFTGIQLRGAGAAHYILEQLAGYGIAPHKLCVEVTEDIVLDRTADAVAEALHVLHAAGVRIALDDFGTGYASLVHLQQIPVDILKIDRSFIAALDQHDMQTRKIVRSILSLSRALQKEVIAEGIETEAQRTQLRRFGCSLGQGYLFSQPNRTLLMPGAARHMAEPPARLRERVSRASGA